MLGINLELNVGKLKELVTACSDRALYLWMQSFKFDF